MAWQLKPDNSCSAQPLDSFSSLQDKGVVSRSGTRGLVGFGGGAEDAWRGANAAHGDGGGVRTNGGGGVGGGGDEGSRMMLVLKKLEDHGKVCMCVK